jgi:predicted amino acid-binding ACT domain protein
MEILTIVAEDKVGLLADISYVLGKSRVNIESLNADVICGKAIVTLALSDLVKGRDVLRASGYGVEDCAATADEAGILQGQPKPRA